MTLPLADIHLPETVSWWPLAPGWWLLALLLTTSIIASVILYKKHKKKWAHRKAALHLLTITLKNWKAEKNDSTAIASFMAIVKRCAITSYSTSNIQGLYGEQWLNFLNQQTSKKYFTQELKHLINQQQYQKDTNKATNIQQINTLYKTCQQWIKLHKAQVTEVSC